MPGKDIGYVRVSTHDQNTARQLDGVHLDKVFEEHASGKSAERPALQACLEYVRDGDTLHVHSIDRLARNLRDLLTIVTELQKQKVTLKFHKENLTFAAGNDAAQGDAFQELQLHIIAAVAQFERALILERQREGIAIAKRAGKYKAVGRKPVLSGGADERAPSQAGKRGNGCGAGKGVWRQQANRLLLGQWLNISPECSDSESPPNYSAQAGLGRKSGGKKRGRIHRGQAV